MIIPYRRHSADCPHASEGREYKKCKCPIWCNGTIDGVEIRQSLDTRDWEEASRKVIKIEAEQKKDDGRVRLSAAWDQFIALKTADGISTGVIKKYGLLRARLEAFTSARGVAYVDKVTLALLTEFRLTWKWGPRTTAKHLERLKSFFGFCAKRRWTAEENPAEGLKPPKSAKELCPTLPFSPEEMTQILTACDTYEKEVGEAGHLNVRRLRTLILLMRYTGLRISDAVNLSADRVKGDKVHLRTAKTHTKVYTVLPAHVVDALAATPRVTGARYFWSGNGKLETCTKDFEGRLRRVLDLAGISKDETFLVSHRFRDTFAVAYLTAGGSMENLSALLGHSSLRVTEKHYAPWVKSRQEKLEASVRAMWAAENSFVQSSVQPQKIVAIR